MQRPVDRARIEEFIRVLAAEFRHPARLYLVGGATIVMNGLRPQTLDIDLTYSMEPTYLEKFFQTVRRFKEKLGMNIKEVSPADFIPLPEGSEDRAIFVGRFGSLDVFHFDPYSTALSKVERGTEKDFADVRAMLQSGMLIWPKLKECFERVLKRYGKESLR